MLRISYLEDVASYAITRMKSFPISNRVKQRNFEFVVLKGKHGR